MTLSRPEAKVLHPDRLAAYLRNRGWQQVAHPNQRLLVFQGEKTYDDGQPIEIVLPASSKYWDSDLILESAINAVAAVEDRTSEEVMQDLAPFPQELPFEKEIAAYAAALEIFTRDAFPEDCALTNWKLGLAWQARYRFTGETVDLDRAIAAFQEAAAYPQPSILLSHARIYYSLGKALETRGYRRRAIAALEKGRAALEARPDLTLRARTLLELGRLYHKELHLSKARLHLKGALGIFQHLEDETYVADTLAALGNVELQSGFFGPACKHLQQARDYYQICDATDLVAEINELLNLAAQAAAPLQPC